MQVPPMYSALKVNGKKLYELAREGKTVERKATAGTAFYEIEILEMDLPTGTFLLLPAAREPISGLCAMISVRSWDCGACHGRRLPRTAVRLSIRWDDCHHSGTRYRGSSGSTASP